MVIVSFQDTNGYPRAALLPFPQYDLGEFHRVSFSHHFGFLVHNSNIVGFILRRI